MPNKRIKSSNPVKETGSGAPTSGKRKASNDGGAPRKRVRFTLPPKEEPETIPEEKQDFQEYIVYRTFFEKYLQLEAIGKGGFSSVFAGVRRADGLPVAIKHIPIAKAPYEILNFGGTEHTLYHEVGFMIAAGCHSHTVGQHAAVTLLDWYHIGEELLLVMERPEYAMDLNRFRELRGGHIQENEAKMILKQLVDAAIHMESKRVFHRDIKLQNLLIHPSSNGQRVRIIDFGCGAHAAENAFESFSGTRKIAPPEWLNRRTYRAHSTTVWQLGVVFYSLLAGHRHFSTKAYMEKRIEVNQALSEDVKTLLAQCLAVDPEERATLQDLQSSLAL